MSEQPRGLPCVSCSGMGHACYTERMVNRIPTCIFCEDQVDCPYVTRERKEKKKAELVAVPNSDPKNKKGKVGIRMVP